MKAKKKAAKKAAVKKPVKKESNLKKAAPKKIVKKVAKKGAAPASGKNAETGIKYSDKSGDQPQLVPIFNKLKELMQPYSKKGMAVRGGTGGQIILVSEKPVTIGGRDRNELWFAGALVQRGYVGFYFSPGTLKPDDALKPELLKTLKGKGCYHIKKADPVIYQQIEDALALGYKDYKEKGMI